MPSENEIKRELLSSTLDLPSNSRTKKEPDEERKLEKVVCGPVKQQKKGLFRRFADAFLEDNTKSVGDYIIHDVLVPAAKLLISDTIMGSVNMMLYGERNRGSRTRREGGRSVIDYNSMAYRGGRDRDRDRPRELSRSAKARHDFDEVIFDSRGDAESVLSELVELVDSQYGQATVADFLDACGLEHSYTDNKFGWTNLHDAYVSRVRGGYVVNLPRTQELRD